MNLPQNKHMTIDQAEAVCEQASIVLNKNTIPGDKLLGCRAWWNLQPVNCLFSTLGNGYVWNA